MPLPAIYVGAGVDKDGDAAVTVRVGDTTILLGVNAAMDLTDVLERKIGQAINWHKLAHDPEPHPLLHVVAEGTA